MSSNALLWPSQGTKPEERLDKYKYLRLPSQGVGGGGGEIIPVNPLLAIYPPLCDPDYTNYKFYQVNKGRFDTPQTNFPWQITDTVGPGVFQQGSGFDIRPFLNNERDIAQAVDTGNTFEPGFTLSAMQLSDDELHLFAWEQNGGIHEWVLSAPGVFPPDLTPSDFEFAPTEVNGKDINFFDNGNKMMILGANADTVEIYSLPIRNSLETTPILLQSFNINFVDPTPGGCDFSTDGMKLYVTGDTTDSVHQWNLTEPFILPAAATPADRVFSFNPPVSQTNGNIRMFPDGSAFYILSSGPDQLCRYDITDDAFDIPIVNKPPDATVDINMLDNNPRSMSVSKDWSLIRFAGRISGLVLELFLPGLLLEYEIDFVNTGTGSFGIMVLVPTIQDLTFIQIAFGNPSATDASGSVGPGDSFSISETPLLTKDEDNFLVDDQGRNIVAVET